MKIIKRLFSINGQYKKSLNLSKIKKKLLIKENNFQEV